ncbi:MAG: DUF2079 domain-containing protein [Acidimicrobiales bacterium]
MQLAGLLAWSSVLYHRFALSWDFSLYYQAAYLVAHGVLNPFSTLVGLPFWRSNGEFLLWPLALLERLGPNGLPLLVVQDLATVGAEAVALRWLLEMLQKGRGLDGRAATVVASTVLALLVFDPWVYWADSFDFHFYAISALVLLLAARELWRKRALRAFAWACLALLANRAGAVAVIGLGVSALLAGRSWRRVGSMLIAAGLLWTLAMTLLPGKSAVSVVSFYGYLGATGAAVASQSQSQSLGHLVATIAQHPGRLLRVLWQRRANLYGNVAPLGLVGILSSWGLGVPALVLLSSVLASYVFFSTPSFQNLPAYGFVAVGTGLVLVTVARRWGRQVLIAGCSLAVLNACVWAGLWIPRLPAQWLRVSPGAADVLRSVQGLAPKSDELVVSQGVGGRFSGRRWLYSLENGRPIPLHGPEVWFVITPYQGVETMPVDAELGLIQQLSGLGAHLVVQRDGVWVYRWVPPASQHTLVVASGSTWIPGSAVRSAVGRPVTTGPPTTWHMTAGRGSGYLVDSAYWRKPPGRYEVGVEVSSSVELHVEVWNASDSRLLLRRIVPASTTGVSYVTAAFTNPPAPSERAYSGVGIWRITPVPPPRYDQLEVRVWTPGGGVANVYEIGLWHVA